MNGEQGAEKLIGLIVGGISNEFSKNIINGMWKVNCRSGSG